MRYLIAFIGITLAACASYGPRQQAQRELDAWHAKNWPLVQSGQIKYSAYFENVESIARRYKVQNGIEFGHYLANQALAYERGEITESALMEDWNKINSGDSETVLRAHYLYLKDTQWEPLCISFGHRKGTPEFNKCVYDVAMQQMSLQQQMLQSMRSSPPIILRTVPPTSTQTECRTYGNTTRCTTN